MTLASDGGFVTPRGTLSETASAFRAWLMEAAIHDPMDGTH
ncbi:hypothetical protein ACU4GH_31600 [Bradyrhizobium betae]